mmetsp:Transcript_42356/g.52128  ORF Transcript_42356/g.52128 Transcript_42356/m.52128 type:complete len:254 (+) Transcript_42356:46-807(+)
MSYLISFGKDCNIGDLVTSLTQNERINALLYGYLYDSNNVYNEVGLINIIDNYIPNDFKIISNKEQQILNAQLRRERIQNIIEYLPKLYNIVINKWGPYLSLIYLLKIITNIVFVIIGYYSINYISCDNTSTIIDPILYLLIGSSIIVGCFIYKSISMCLLWPINNTCAADIIGTPCIILLVLVTVLEHIFILIWCVIGIIMQINYNNSTCNIPIINYVINSYIIIELILMLPSWMMHNLFAYSLLFYNYDDE